MLFMNQFLTLRRWFAGAVILLLGICASRSAPALPAPTFLRCEDLSHPLGVDHAQPRLSWRLEAETTASAPRSIAQSGYRILVATSLERLSQDDGNLWDSGVVRSAASVHVAYAGKPLVSRQRCFWKVRVIDSANTPSPWSLPDFWTMGLLSPTDWQARWITSSTGTTNHLPLFRTFFRIEKPVRRAELAICGLGFHETTVNGSRLDETVLEPGWTDYRKTCLYHVHDLTDRLIPGDNVLGVMLGNGMYHVPGGRYVKFTGSFGPPKLIAQLDIEFADGTSTRVISGPNWKTTAGPITFSCIFGGEDYDARRERPGWDRAPFNDAGWHNAQVCDGPGGRLTTRSGPPLRSRQSLATVRRAQPQPGKWVYDLGQNFSGWPGLEVRGPAGSTVKLITGELLDAAGLVSQGSSGSPVWFAYTLKGDGTETWNPRFSYTGFRYVQVEGAVPDDEPGAAENLPRVVRLVCRPLSALLYNRQFSTCSIDLRQNVGTFGLPLVARRI
jgi:hypothetical protein